MDEAAAFTTPAMNVEAARRTLAVADAAECWDSVSRLARSNQSKVLQPLPYDEGHEFADPSVVHVPPDVSGLDTVALYAGAAFRDFDRVLVQAFRAPEVSPTLTALYNRIIHDQSNVALVTNHGEIIDIALVLAALSIAMCHEDRTMGALGDRLDLETFADRASLVVSRMVCTRQAFDLPAIEVVQNMCHTFLSLPQTVSRRRARLDPEYARANNVVMRAELDARLAQGGHVLAMAASGSQDLSAAEGLWRKVRTNVRNTPLGNRLREMREAPEAPTLHLQPLYAGTIRLMTSCEYALPVATSLDAESPRCVIGEMTRVRNEDDAHGIMEWIANAHEQATGTHTEYHRKEDDLLTQLRETLAKKTENR